MIPVTKSFLPPIEEYTAQVQRAYNNGWLTNRGELVLELEEKLTAYLQLEQANILLMTNGTIPLQIALKCLAQGGEVITTPFSYVATTSTIVWEGCTPVFVDIHPEYLTLVFFEPVFAALLFQIHLQRIIKIKLIQYKIALKHIQIILKKLK